jgi:DNA-binding protein HU-beta
LDCGTYEPYFHSQHRYRDKPDHRPEESVNKSEFIAVLEERLGSRRNAAEALDAVIEIIQRQVAKGERVVISGFGSFEKAVRAARVGRNPRTGETVKVKKTSVPRFRPGTAFKGFVADPRSLPKPAKATAAGKAAAGKAAANGAAPVRAVTTRARTTPIAAVAAKTTAARTTPAKATPAAPVKGAARTTPVRATRPAAAGTPATKAVATRTAPAAKAVATKAAPATKTVATKAAPATKTVATKAAPATKTVATKATGARTTKAAPAKAAAVTANGTAKKAGAAPTRAPRGRKA